jgi:hypothetical protein
MIGEWPINCDNRVNHRFKSGHQKRGEYAKIAALTQPALGSDVPYSGSTVRFMPTGDAHAGRAGHHRRHC